MYGKLYTFPGIVPLIELYLVMCVKTGIDAGALFDEKGNLNEVITEPELSKLFEQLSTVKQMI